jgi:hypothetical protein
MQVGPFRNGVLEIFTVLKNGGSLRDHIHYRIVQFSDTEGNNHRIWLKIIESNKKGLQLTFSPILSEVRPK